MKKFICAVVAMLMLMCSTITAFADDGRVTVTHNEGGTVTAYEKATEVSSGVYTVSGNSQILFYVTAEPGYELAHVYFNEQDLGYTGTGTKQIWVSPNGSGTALRVEFISSDSDSNNSEADSSDASSDSANSNASSSSEELLSSSEIQPESENTASESESTSIAHETSSSASSQSSGTGGNGLGNDTLMSDGMGVVQSDAKHFNFGKIGLVAAIVASVVGAGFVVIHLIKKARDD